MSSTSSTQPAACTGTDDNSTPDAERSATAGTGPLPATEAAAGSTSGVRPPGAPTTGIRPPYTGPTTGMTGGQGVRQPVYGLGMIVSLGVALAVFVLAIIAIGDPNASDYPLAQTTNLIYWFLAVLIIAASGIGSQYAERTAAQAAAAVGRPRPDSAMATAWTVPVVATLAAILLVATYHNRIMLLVGPLIAFLGNAGALLSRDLLDDAGDSTHRTATAIHTLVIHAVAFLALSAVYLNKLSTWIGAPLVGVIAGLLVLETLERGTAPRIRRLLYALLGGAVVAEALVALNWWQTHGWTGGAVLLVCFYLAAGVLLAATQRTALRTRDLVEFGLVGLVAFAVLAVTA